MNKQKTDAKMDAKTDAKTDAKQCPWCQRWCLKDNNCDYIFACGLDAANVFHIGQGCGHSWCWTCSKKYCGQLYDPVTGQRKSEKTQHDHKCCTQEPDFKQEDYCPGGHSSHCAKRW